MAEQPIEYMHVMKILYVVGVDGRGNNKKTL